MLFVLCILLISVNLLLLIMKGYCHVNSQFVKVVDITVCNHHLYYDIFSSHVLVIIILCGVVTFVSFIWTSICIYSK